MSRPADPFDHRVLFVLGGARSGKSAHALAAAEALAMRHGLTRIYIATAQAFDAEMAERIARHRAERSDGWITEDVPHALPDRIAALSSTGTVLLVDCLTLWTSNRLLADADLDADRTALVESLRRSVGPVILVANEVGLGIVPDNALARRFRDAAGLLNQAVAGQADQVIFVAAGLPLTLKRRAPAPDPDAPDHPSSNRA